MKCQFTKTDGKPCQANALKTDVYCFSHSDLSKDKKQEAVSKGGRGNKKDNNRKVPVDIKDRDDVKRILIENINALRTEEMTVHQVNAIGYQLNILLGILPNDGPDNKIGGFAGFLKWAEGQAGELKK